MRSYISPDSAVKHLQPENPVVIYRPHALKRAAELFLSQFRGRVMYAVKTNPDEHVVKDLWAAGLRDFDCASLHEVAMVRGLFPEANIFFMHTIKSRHAIREAYHRFGVRHFSLDTHEELQKILDETGNAADLGLHVRLAIPNNYAELALTDKFGIAPDAAPKLLAAVRAVAVHAGVCFHVGSQCMHADAYRVAVKMAKQVIKQAGVKIDSLDVGGGFPSIYPGMTPPDMASFFQAIHESTRDLTARGVELLCEPGRALVAESGAVIARVVARKGDFLYLNDGTYGALFDAGMPKFIFPVRRLDSSPIRGEVRRGAQPAGAVVSITKTEQASPPPQPSPYEGGSDSAQLKAFSFYGPTCDSYDFMKGPFFLPADMTEGDYIEIGQLGAYGRTMATRFNGFALANQIIGVKDEPLMSLYATEPQIERRVAMVARA